MGCNAGVKRQESSRPKSSGECRVKTTKHLTRTWTANKHVAFDKTIVLESSLSLEHDTPIQTYSAMNGTALQAPPTISGIIIMKNAEVKAGC